MDDLGTLARAVETGDRAGAASLAQAALDAGFAPRDILAAMTEAMFRVGARFAAGEGVYIPEMLISAHAMKRATTVLEPHLVADGIVPTHTAVIGTVKGDLHDIGKDLVAMMWRGAGFRVVDLGVNVGAERFVRAADEEGAHLVGLSALLTTTMIEMGAVVRALRDAGMGSIPVIVGGAPLDQPYADEIGAAGYAKDAATAVVVARRLIGREGPPQAASGVN